MKIHYESSAPVTYWRQYFSKCSISLYIYKVHSYVSVHLSGLRSRLVACKFNTFILHRNIWLEILNFYSLEASLQFVKNFVNPSELVWTLTLVTVNPGLEFVDFLGPWKPKLMIIESYMAKSQSVKWLALDWIRDFESFKGRIFSVCRTIHKGSELHPSSSQWHRFISDVKANVVSIRSLPTSGFDVSNFRNPF